MLKYILLLNIFLLFIGCTKPTSIYHWGNYQNELLNHFKKDTTSSSEQLESLKEMKEEARSKHRPLPPGYNAHMGLLYLKLGDIKQFKKHLQLEKKLFPESSGYIDFLLKE